MNKYAFIDRDGTLIDEPELTKQINGLEQLRFLPNIISSLKKLQDCGFRLIIVTNQDGLGELTNPIDNFNLINSKIIEILQSEEIKIESWFVCPHFISDFCNCRKPLLGLVTQLLPYIDLNDSFVIGDRESDLEFAKNIGVAGYQINADNNWNSIVKKVTSRSALINRKTEETDVKVKLNIDGDGKSEIETGIHFLDHMLNQVSKHAKFDLKISCKGDLHIDEHHTIEDVAITLGMAFKKALSDKKGIQRFSSERIVPLDESLSFVSLDISGRPYCLFEARFEREYCGDLPTEMISHFFQSFVTAAEITLHIKISGLNTHHKIESCFKAFAKCLADSTRRSGSAVSSTKGLL